MTPNAKPRAGEHTKGLIHLRHLSDGSFNPRYVAALETHRDALAAQNRELVEALGKLVELGDHVPVFQLDDGKSSVKAVRLAGKFMNSMAAARALLAKVQDGR